MANMKALPMLDHVMLWVARCGAAVILLCMLGSIPAFCDGYGYYSLGGSRPIFPIIHYWRDVINWSGFQLLVALVVTFLQNLGLWRPEREFFRLYLLLVSSSLFIIDALGVVFISEKRSTYDWACIVGFLVSYFAMAWTGLRAPGHRPIQSMKFTFAH